MWEEESLQTRAKRTRLQVKIKKKELERHALNEETLPWNKSFGRLTVSRCAF